MAARQRVAPASPRQRDAEGVAFVCLGGVLGWLMVTGSGGVYAVQNGVAEATDLLPVGYAFAAGMVAAVNPCGVLLLPSAVAYYLTRGVGSEAPAARRVGRALLLAAMATLGFVALFAVVGLVIGAGGRALAGLFPVGGLIVGVALVVTGAWLALSGRGLGVLAASRSVGAGELGDARSLFLFGVGYGVCSLSCTLPVFLVVAGTALASGGLLAATGQFVGYALGMGLMLTAVILGATFFQAAVTRWTRAVVPYVHRLAAAFLLGAGIFVVHYWWASGALVR